MNTDRGASLEVALGREYALEAIQEKRRGGWGPESTPGHNGDEEGVRVLEEVERAAVSEFLQSEEALDRVADALAAQRFRRRSTVGVALTVEDLYFCKAEAEVILKALRGECL